MCNFHVLKFPIDAQKSANDNPHTSDSKLLICVRRFQSAKATVSNQKNFLELQKEVDKVLRIIMSGINLAAGRGISNRA